MNNNELIEIGYAVRKAKSTREKMQLFKQVPTKNMAAFDKILVALEEDATRAATTSHWYRNKEGVVTGAVLRTSDTNKRGQYLSMALLKGMAELSSEATKILSTPQ